MANIFCDYHHTDLLYSLQLLLEKRLGHNLYRPIGLEWYEEGYWAVYPSIDTAEQYLGMRQGFKPNDGTLPLNEIRAEATRYNFKEGKGIYLCEDNHNNSFHQAITLEQFKEMDFDIIIASIPQHIAPFKKLAEMKNAKLIYQIGNQWDVNASQVKNVMASAKVNIPPEINGVTYHQEFDLDIFRPADMKCAKRIVSFINILNANGGAKDYYTLKAELPEYEFRSYGAQTDDGVMNTTNQIAAIMQTSYFGFHVKRGGDGYGHILFNWLACGKPIITRLSDYKGKMAEPLLIDGETCLDLDSHSLSDIIDEIRNMEPNKYQWMCQRAKEVFDENVNFKKDAELVKDFLGRLQ